MITYVVANQKGGTGKSTISCHLAMHKAEKGERVAFINCETQGNSSGTLKKKYPCAPVKADSFFKKEMFPIESLGSITIYEGGGFLADIERVQGGYFKQHVARLAASNEFDSLVIDVPPTANILQIAPLSAADFVLSPIEMEEYSMQGVADMLKTIMGVRERYNPKMQFLGILPNRLKGTSPRQKNALRELLSKYPQYVFASEHAAKVSERQAIPEALALGIPVWELRKSSAREASEEMRTVFKLMDEKVALLIKNANAGGQ